MTADYPDTAPGAYFVEVQNLPDAVLSYLLPSRYCESDRFGDLARAITERMQPGYDQVRAICDWTRANVAYRPGSSILPLSAVEVAERHEGVCRDLAHLGVAMCRSISIPARLVVGFLHGLEPMDLHAWFEAYVGGRWYIFDPTQYRPAGGRVAVAYGRDAADVAIYHLFGLPPLFSALEVHVDWLADPPG
jgi:transglutaminase-like putative cysteine protease